MTTLDSQQQEFGELISVVHNLGEALIRNDFNQEIPREIDLALARFMNLREALSTPSADLPSGSLPVVTCDLYALRELNRDREKCLLLDCQATPTGRISFLKLEYIDGSEMTILPLLSQLSHLIIQDFGESDCSPLGELTKLARLEMCNGRIANYSFLDRLDKLYELNLTNVGLKSLEPIARLIQLESLSAGSNSIKDISAIESFNKLRRLELPDNRSVVDLTPLANVPSLEMFILRQQKPSCLEVLLQLPVLNFVLVSQEIAEPARNLMVLEELEKRKVCVCIS